MDLETLNKSRVLSTLRLSLVMTMSVADEDERKALVSSAVKETLRECPLSLEFLGADILSRFTCTWLKEAHARALVVVATAMMEANPGETVNNAVDEGVFSHVEDHLRGAFLVDREVQEPLSAY